MVKASYLQPRGRRFESRPLGFTQRLWASCSHTRCLCSPNSIHWYRPLAGKVWRRTSHASQTQWYIYLRAQRPEKAPFSVLRHLYITTITNITLLYYEKTVIALCVVECLPGNVKCPGGNGRCINEISMCNGYNNCGDNSDEGPHFCQAYGQSFIKLTVPDFGGAQGAQKHKITNIK